ncbi:cell wall-associated NlpC family hydrolase [Flavobacterium sp. 28A]|uniref:C40 family peptidase n=1 Tax=Flavobacterium sp. 28A TaxID=2735895 RepID=UPI00156E6DDD|nr:C40 family peptidase [Flavobacterium sp. 28A]NRT16412.1 cell wall-associated NlpC family hydrolase [Flavobacterium sp. 28A]
MTYKNINYLKLGSSITLLLTVLSSFTNTSSVIEKKAVPQSLAKAQLSVKEKLIIPTNNEEQLRDSIVVFGNELLGTPYVTAGTSSKGFDCSGFVYYVFKEFEIKVPRSSSLFKNFGEEIPIADVKKGDILLFLSPTRNAIGHIGIVSEPNGMQSNFIHASSSKKMQVMISSLTQKGYTRRFVKAVRVL